jgi:hypothetical protein
MEVYHEVVVPGSGLPGGAIGVADAQWIKVTAVKQTAEIQLKMEQTGLDRGETAAVQLDGNWTMTCY